MALPQAKPRRYTVEEYLRLEERAEEKHEYHDGEVLAMSGGSPGHSLITMNAGAVLHGLLRGKDCRVYDGNLRVWLPARNRYVYPDLSVVCGPVQYAPRDPSGQSVTNPSLIVEVLSPTTEAYDRGEKFDQCQQIGSLREYVLISQATPRVETFLRRADGGWLLNTVRGIDAVAALRSIGGDLPLAEVYAGVEFPPAGTTDRRPEAES